MTYWAKSNPKQTVWEHTWELLRLWERALAVYGGHFSEAERELIRLAAYYHDIGKINPHFQADICRSMKGDGGQRLTGAAGIPHGFLSCAYMDVGELEDKYEKDIEWLVMAIFNHHQRQDTYSDAQLTKYIEEFLPEHFCLDGKKTLMRGDDYLDYLDDTLRNNGSGAKGFPNADWLRYAVIKGMLNRLDYAASGGEPELELAPLPAGILTQKVQQKWPELRPVQAYMKERREENLVVLAATGSGKTEAALYWIDGSKCFYTLPLKVSINVIYERIRDQYEYGEDKMTLLHSDLLAYYFMRQDNENEKEQAGGDDPLSRRSKARLLSYPLTICTADQLFWFVFKAMGSETIPATLKYSRLIIDEIQMYSPDIMAYMIYGIKLLTELGCRFAVLTATFPPVLGHFMRKEGISFMMPQEPFLGAYSSRHKIALCQGDFDYEEIAAAGREQKVLVLCNTVSKAQEAYAALLGNCPNCRLLHSRFIRRDRKRLEDAIMAFSKAPEPGIWISTQIVEASLDIDFDVLYTEMCPADSLLQRMGRCYRKRDNETGQVNVYIYNTGNGYGTVYRYKHIFDQSWALLKKYDGGYFLEQDKFAYIEEVYAVEALKGGAYYTQIETNIAELKKLPPAALDTRKAHALFRNIQSVTVLPDVFYQDEQVQQCIAVLREKKKHSLEELVKAENTLMQYTVSVDARLLYSKRKAYIDSLPIREIHWLNVHRATARYAFDGENAQGLCIYEEDTSERFS